MTPGTFLGGPDYGAAWIRVDRLIHRVVGHRLDAQFQFDRLIIVHRCLERRLAN